MNTRTHDNFIAELMEARRKLQEIGRPVLEQGQIVVGDGISCDFELPYSSLPEINSSRWKQMTTFE